MQIELALITRGGDQSGAIAGLVPHLLADPMPLHLVTRDPIDRIQRALLDEITVTRESGGIKGVGRARAEALRTDADVVVMLDDDAVVTPIGGLRQLAWMAARRRCWVNPIIRYAENLLEPLPDHAELWHPVHALDHRVRRATARYGPGWIRTFDVGFDVATDQLGGTCVAIPTSLPTDPVIAWLDRWPVEAGDEDQFLGKALGMGYCTRNVVAWHWGAWHTGEPWGIGPVEEGLRWVAQAQEVKAASPTN